MKNTNYLWIMLLAFGIDAGAQQSYAEAFAPFDFSLGNIDGQNGWQAFTAQAEPFGGCTVSDDNIEMFSTPNYVKIDHDPNFPASDGLDFFCLSPFLVDAPFELAEGDGSVSFYIQPDNDSQTPGANYALQFDDGVQITASFLLLSDGTIAVADKINGILQYVPTGATWTAGEVKQYNIHINLQAGTLLYNIQGVDVHSGHALNGVALERFSVAYDNQPGSVAYFDEIFVFGNSEVSGIVEPALPQISLYPNPATEMLTISRGDGFTHAPATVYGIDGKILPVPVAAQDQGTETLDVSCLASGTYFIGIPTHKGVVQRKFIRQ